MNKHIEKYLESYLNLNKPEFAVLLIGKWGSGKTYFIDKFIEENIEEEIKFIKISLFGLKEVDSIDEQIFQSIHPILGHKYTKLGGNVIKNALKLGITLDWNDDSKNDGTSTVDLSKFNPLDFFSDKKKSKVRIIFVFDDLERTDIELTEILGYINYLVEQSDFNIILLANEEKIIEEEDKKESSKYIEFKEKVIGKTFEVQHDFDRILISLISENTDKSKKYLNENKDIIRDIYTKAEHHNLRHIKQTLLDFEYFIKEVDEKYLKNKEFISILINNFFALSIEAKGGKLKEEELYKNLDSIWNFMEDEKTEKTDIEKIYEKYDINKNPIFSGKGWVNIIFKSALGSEVLNKVISDLSFFLETKKKERETWVKLWHYHELENIEFEALKQDVLEKFNNCEYEVHQHFLHVIALLISFSKKGLCDLSLVDIEKQVSICMEKYKKTSIWKENLFENRMRFNHTGLGYMDDNNKEFRKLYQLVMDENKKVYYEMKEEINKKKLKNLLLAIKQNDEEVIRELLLNEYREKPIFKKLSIKDFFQIFKNIDNKNLIGFRSILQERYPDNYRVNGQNFYCYYLKEELKFWKEVDKQLEKYINDTITKNLRSVLIDEFHKLVIKNIVEKLESCN